MVVGWLLLFDGCWLFVGKPQTTINKRIPTQESRTKESLPKNKRIPTQQTTTINQQQSTINNQQILIFPFDQFPSA